MSLKIKYLFLLILSFIFNNIYSQVNIGKSLPPEDFSVLQIEETTQPKGLRLSQISSFSAIDSKISTSGATGAIGLFVYDMILKKVRYWDGSKWVISGKNLLTAGNGLDNVNSYTGLGTTLLNNTTLNLNSYSFDFITNRSVFSLNNQVKISNGKVNFDSETVKLGPNTELQVTGSVAGGTNKINLQNYLLIESENTSLANSTDTTLTLTNELILRDVTRPTMQAEIDETNIKKKYYAFSNDENGDVFWGQLSPVITIVTGTFLSNVTVGSSATAASNPITLTTGKWMIYARLPFRSTYNGMYLWSTIHNSANKIQLGIGTSVDTNGFCIPEILGIVEVTGASDNFTLKLSTSNANNASNWLSASLISNFGEPEFFAILLDKPITR